MYAILQIRRCPFNFSFSSFLFRFAIVCSHTRVTHVPILIGIVAVSATSTVYTLHVHVHCAVHLTEQIYTEHHKMYF